MKQTSSLRRSSRSPLALSVALALLSFHAVAQDSLETPVSEAADVAVLETVQVTAERRIENIQKVPVSITTLKGEKLDVIKSGGEDVRVLAGRMPSLYVEGSFGRAFPRFYIRGLGNLDFDLNASQPVSLVYDDVVQENPILKGFPMFDLDQVELLRGPQGTLFGRNSPGGVVKFNSAAPTEEFDGYAKFSHGSYGTLNAEGAVSGPVGDTVSLRFSGLYQERDDYVDNTLNGPGDDLEGYQENAARLQLLWKPSEDFEALFNVHSRDLDGTARLFRANIIRPGSNEFVLGFDRDRISIDGTNYQQIDSHGANVRLRWDFDQVSLFSITGYESVNAFSRGDIDGGFGAAFLGPGTFGPGFIPFASESADGLPEHRQLTQEFRLQSNNDGGFNWQAGAFWFDESFDVLSFSYDTLFGGGVNGWATQTQENTAWAVYGSADFQATDKLKLKGGLRYTKDEKDFVAQRFSSPLGFLGFGPLGPIYVSTEDSDVSWDASAVYSFNDTVNGFVRIAKGFRAPSIQGRALFGDNNPANNVTVADSETNLSLEVGVKADLWERRARLGVTVYRFRVDDQQLTAVGGVSNTARLVNADRVNGYGLEVDLDVYVTDRLLVSFGGSYNFTEIDDADLAVFGCGGGCTVIDPAGTVPGTFLIDGNPLPHAPKHVYNVTARYGVPTEKGEFFIYTDWAYRSTVNFNLYESLEFNGDSLLEGGLRVGYNWNDGDRQVSLFGRNITDATELVGGIDFNNLTGFINEPRTWGVEFRADF